MTKKKVLIIDDETSITKLLKFALERTDRYTVEAENSGRKAMTAIRTFLPDVILLDVNMPGTDGLTLLQSLRRHGVTAPAFVITGYDAPGQAARAQQLGATKYMVKPVDLRELDRQIADTLKTKRLTKD